ncbi:MAG: endonuclease [Alphaproteobacteria bacterium]|nr:MAG: endonuclease [Alphaproteobacteria bacterium]
MGWYVYILECSDTTYYTGITTDIERRIGEHTAGVGAKYTKGRGPLKLMYQEEHADRSFASKREIEIKSLSKAQKLVLISR